MTYSKPSKRERDDLLKIQQLRETTYSKSSKRERDDLFKIQQQTMTYSNSSNSKNTQTLTQRQTGGGEGQEGIKKGGVWWRSLDNVGVLWADGTG